MPRDDLSIDFVKRMAPSAEAQDPGVILDDWINRTTNLPEEIRFIQDEIADRDRTYSDCIRAIEESDSKIQRWIRTQGSHVPNPREEGLRKAIGENYEKADVLAAEKVALSQKMQNLMDKHLRQLDAQIKVLYDRNEPGFSDPDELPSLLRPSAANHSNTSLRVLSVSTNPTALNPIVNNATPTVARLATTQARTTQAQQQISNSAPATPAASMILNRNTRESSAGPGSGAPKRGPRTNSGLNNAPVASSGLARHSSIGPGTPKAGTPTATGRAGSTGPRALTKNAGTARKLGTPTGLPSRKKPPPNGKSTLSRVKRASKASPTSTADSELSDADSTPSSRARSRAGSGTPGPNKESSALVAHHNSQQPKDGEGTADAEDAEQKNEETSGSSDEEEDEEGKKYCLCQHVSYGDMVACDNPDCPYEWFHWNCVGLKSEPEGRWFCPSCTGKRGK